MCVETSSTWNVKQCIPNLERIEAKIEKMGKLEELLEVFPEMSAQMPYRWKSLGQRINKKEKITIRVK
ncbi:MAG: hypothetical protein PQ964_08900 [Methanobacteriaceae archaeon]|jgi:hypothetical protein